MTNMGSLKVYLLFKKFDICQRRRGSAKKGDYNVVEVSSEIYDF